MTRAEIKRVIVEARSFALLISCRSRDKSERKKARDWDNAARRVLDAIDAGEL